MAFTGGVSRENGQNFETNAGYMYPPAVSSSGDYGGSGMLNDEPVIFGYIACIVVPVCTCVPLLVAMDTAATTTN
jgi:hypothetical protein